ncbi:hypothetical protein LOTGIDRAFT_230039 [Lottia gigantea]|uniref:Surfeit locus protein 2 n=1 Tax=Lottia gigantea TaxID=225164 RepID=V4ALB3_LOTGI|nr:hypothetical protein LOTGIDRAFT_230039 [Lottia gigantea]ESP04989.1 hypothetical protein LOTGIDRAFT_230039 [Lottia gigantea]
MAALKKHVGTLDTEVEELLKKYRELELDKETNKIKCCLSGHEMPSTELAITTYISGKKFLKLKAQSDYNYDEHADHLVPSTKKFHEKHLYCRLTQIHVNHTPKDIDRHINGRKFKRALREWKRCQETGEKFKPFGNLQKQQQQNDEDNMSDNDEKFSMFGNLPTKGSKVKNPVAVSASAVGDGGFLDIDSDDDDRPVNDDDDFSDLYPEEEDGNEKEDDGGGSDFDFDEMEVTQKQAVEDKPKKLSKTLNGKKHKLPLPQKKKVKRLKSS